MNESDGRWVRLVIKSSIATPPFAIREMQHPFQNNCEFNIFLLPGMKTRESRIDDFFRFACNIEENH